MKNKRLNCLWQGCIKIYNLSMSEVLQDFEHQTFQPQNTKNIILREMGVGLGRVSLRRGDDMVI